MDDAPIDEPRQRWWSKSCGGREVLGLALPLMISMASWAVMNFADRMFLFWHSSKAVAAALPAGALYFAIFCFPLGISSYVNTFVSQYNGAGRTKRIGLSVWQGVWVGVAWTPIFLATIPLVPLVFHLSGHASDIVEQEAIYYRALTLGAGGGVISAAFSSFFTGLERTKVVMVVDSSAALLNVVLDYLLIFGVAGFPEMGIAGAGLATSISQWCRALIYWRVMMRAKNVKPYGLVSGRRWDTELSRRLWYYGSANGLQLLVEVTGITGFILLVGNLGEHAMVSTTLAFNINSVAFVPMLGLGVAVSTLVGNHLGKDRDDLAVRTTWTALQIGVGYSGLMALLYVCLPDVFLWGHAANSPIADFGTLRDTVVVLLRFVAAYCTLDAMQIVFVSVLKGAGDTRFVLWTALATAPLPVVATWLGVVKAGWGLYWCWIVVTAWITALAIIYLVRFRQGRWKSMRVIEPEVTAP